LEGEEIQHTLCHPPQSCEAAKQGVAG